MKLTVKDVDEKTIKTIAREYLSGSYVTLQSIATKYRCTQPTISNILRRGIAENILDQKVAKCIYNKIVAKPSIGWYQRKLRWDEAFAERQKKIRELERDYEVQLELDSLNALKEHYEHAISSYGSYFFDEQDAPSLDSLEANLETIKKRIKALS